MQDSEVVTLCISRSPCNPILFFTGRCMADFDAACEDNLVIHDGFTYRDLDVDEKTSCKVSTKEAYIHLLKQQGALVRAL